MGRQLHFLGDTPRVVTDTVTGKNSDYAKAKTDKVLTAKLFRESVDADNIKLDTTTTTNAKALFKQLMEKFKNYRKSV